ncbi:MAG: hypothetical protein M0P57_14085 [Syntrophales bacterium]|nr:hypothetical protein [Syntrophales bacterium]MDY0044435.1 hypothetical protein [Syntrophales bacterium]
MMDLKTVLKTYDSRRPDKKLQRQGARILINEAYAGLSDEESGACGMWIFTPSTIE